MRLVYECPEAATALGEQARKDIINQLHPDVVGKQMRQRLTDIAAERGIIEAVSKPVGG
jgi:hypothetical protein